MAQKITLVLFSACILEGCDVYERSEDVWEQEWKEKENALYDLVYEEWKEAMQ